MSNGDNARKFAEELREFAVKVAPGHARDAAAAIALQGLRKVIAKTPVNTGHARNGWQVTIGAPLFLEPPGSDTMKEPAPAVDSFASLARSSAFGRGRREIEAAPEFSQIFIANAVEYIEVLEDGRLEGEAAGEGDLVRAGGVFGLMGRRRKVGARGSIQAPNGMLAVSFQELVEDLSSEETA